MDQLERVKGLIGARADVRVLPCDLSDLDAVSTLVARAEGDAGPVDTLINNAGLEHVARTPSMSVEDGERVLRVNLLAPLRLMHAVMPAMVARRAGTIVNVTSVAGLISIPYTTHYSTSKAALSMASEHLRLELAPAGVNVLTVYPGPIVTPMGERAAAAYEKDVLPRFLWGSVGVLATRTARAMDAGCARILYPRLYHVCRMFPNFFRWAQFQLAPPPHKS